METQIIEPGRYDYDLKIEFDSVYIPEHTPPLFRNASARPTVRWRNAASQIDVSAHLDRGDLRNHLVQQISEDLLGQEVRILHFKLTPVTA